ncbi:uncharacterized protein [Miscanthus floridulus]|uniref:uncharacterized protein isoform X2 n=1 Tax=Miscanthus floridulus TaxID=154761 RepID=UPI003458D45E
MCTVKHTVRIDALPTSDVDQERCEDKKRKRAHEDDIIIREEAREVQVNDDAVQTPVLQKTQHMMRADDDVTALPRYNKPKKSNNAQIMTQDYVSTKQDDEVIEYMKGKSIDHKLVRINDAWGCRDDLDCLFKSNEQVNGAVISLYIELMRHEEHLLHRDGGDVYLENSMVSQMLRIDGKKDERDLSYNRDEVVQTRAHNYLHADMVFLPINIEKFHWYLGVVNASLGQIHVLDSFGDNMTNFEDLWYTLLGMESLIKYATGLTKLDQSKWKHGTNMTSWPMKHKIKVPMQTDGCGLWLLNYMEYWTGSTLSDHVTQEDISNFRFKLPAILYNSLLNEIRGLPDKEQNTKTGDDLHELVEELNDLDILMSGNTKLTRTLKWTNREDLLTTICGLFHLIADDETLEKEWIRSTRPYPISLSLRQIINILDDDRQLEHETFNMAIRMVACNQDIAQKKQIFHYMDLKFAEITHFG